MANFIKGVEEDNPLKFFFDGKELHVGTSHRSILIGLGWPNNDMEIRQKLKGRDDLDMGFIMRIGGGRILIGSISDTYDYPRGDIFKTVRRRTMEILPLIYDGEKFERI